VPSFIDSERVNAGISEVSNEIDNGKFDIPHDLWREDTLSIQHQKKIRTVKKRRAAKAVHYETATPVDPELLVE